MYIQEKLVGIFKREYSFNDLISFVRTEYDSNAYCIAAPPLERARVAFKVGHELYVIEHELKKKSKEEIITKIFFTATTKNSPMIEEFVQKIGPFDEVVLRKVS